MKDTGKGGAGRFRLQKVDFRHKADLESYIIHHT